MIKNHTRPPLQYGSIYHICITSRLLLLLIFVSLPTLIKSEQCRKFECEVSKENGECARVFQNDSTSVAISPCSNSSNICLLTSDINSGTFSSFSCIDPIVISSPWKYPGESCQSNSECHSGNCSNAICVGKLENQSCTHQPNSFCDVGLYCIEMTCQKQKSIGQFCLRDFECVNNAFCYTVNYTCVPYLALQPGEKSVTATDSIAFECASLYSSNGYCAYAPMSLNDYSKTPCNSDLDCQLTDGLFSKCACGYNAEGNKYCVPAQGDPVYSVLLSKFKALLWGNTDCFSDLRFSPRCSSLKTLGAEFEALSTYARSAHLTYNNPPCVRQTLTQFMEGYDFEAIPKVTGDIQQALESRKKNRLDPVAIVLISATIISVLIVVGCILHKKHNICEFMLRGWWKDTNNDSIVGQDATHSPSRVISPAGLQKGVLSNKQQHEDELGMREIKFFFDEPVIAGASPEKDSSNAFLPLNESGLEMSQIDHNRDDSAHEKSVVIAPFSLQQAAFGGEEGGTRKLTTYTSVEFDDPKSIDHVSQEAAKSHRSMETGNNNDPQQQVARSKSAMM